MNGFKMTAERTDNHNKNFRNADAWTVRITNPRGEKLQRKFYMGYGHKGATPKLADVMEALITDAACYESADGSPAAFMAEFGYEDRAEAIKAYKACQRTAERLETFLTEDERLAFTEH